MTKEAEIPVMHVPGSPEGPAATKSWERPEPDATSSLRGSQPCPHLDFQLRINVRCLSCPVCGHSSSPGTFIKPLTWSLSGHYWSSNIGRTAIALSVSAHLLSPSCVPATGV